MKKRIKLVKSGLSKRAAKNKLDSYDKRDKNCSEIIARHPQAKLIISSLQEGLSATAIARYMALHGLIRQCERTFADYIQAFKRANPKLFQDDADILLDKIVTANKPPIDVEAELHRMYRIQKLRISIGVRNELASRRIKRDHHRELAVAKDYLEAIARIEGKIRPKAEDNDYAQYSPDVIAELQAIKVDERTRLRLNRLTNEFFKSLKEEQELKNGKNKDEGVYSITP